MPSTPVRSSSSGQQVSLSTRLSEALTLFRTAWNRQAKSPTELFAGYARNIDEYSALFHQHTGNPIETARIVEVGFGARPYRLATFHARRLNAYGIDLDMPVLDGSIREFLNVWRNNGIERALKSIVRHYVADRTEQRKFKTYHRYEGSFLDRDKLIVGSAASPEAWQGLQPVDLITSEDVVEHIPLHELTTLVGLMAENLSSDGLALICPNIFTGITGGHLLEWYHDVVNETGKSTEPWEHLRQDRVPVNTYLNRLTRADYRRLFALHFDIVEEIVRQPNLGRQWWTEAVRRDLATWPDEELFSNQVVFVLRPKKSIRQA